MKLKKIYSINILNLDISKVTNISFIFNECKKLKGLNNFNTNNAIKMNSMFQECNELKYLNLSTFNTSKMLLLWIIWLMNVKNKKK